MPLLSGVGTESAPRLVLSDTEAGPCLSELCFPLVGGGW